MIVFISILVLIYLVAAFFIAYHLVRFGAGFETKLLAFVFSLGVIVLVLALFIQYNTVEIPSVLPDFSNPF